MVRGLRAERGRERERERESEREREGERGREGGREKKREGGRERERGGGWGGASCVRVPYKAGLSVAACHPIYSPSRGLRRALLEGDCLESVFSSSLEGDYFPINDEHFGTMSAFGLLHFPPVLRCPRLALFGRAQGSPAPDVVRRSFCEAGTSHCFTLILPLLFHAWPGRSPFGALA